MELDRYFARYQGKEEPYLSFANDSGKYKVLYKNLSCAETNKRNVMLHFDGLELILTTGKRIPISQPKRKDFMVKLTDYWGNML